MALSLIFAIKMLSTILYKELTSIDSVIGSKVKLVNGSQFKELYNEQLANQGDDPFDYTGWDANTDWQEKFSRLLHYKQ